VTIITKDRIYYDLKQTKYTAEKKSYKNHTAKEAKKEKEKKK
jgi:hypothetical protein